MPRIKSAIKRVEIADRNNQRNKSWKSAIRTARNRVEDAIGSADTSQAAEALKTAYSLIDRAVSKGILHRNTGARRKAVLASKLLSIKPSKKK